MFYNFLCCMFCPMHTHNHKAECCYIKNNNLNEIVVTKERRELVEDGEKKNHSSLGLFRL